MFHQWVTRRNGLAAALGQNTGALDVTSRRARLWTLSIILAVGAFYLSTIKPGHNWGDDFAMYILHARNIAEGKPYADTGYIYNPRWVIGPVTYPPIYPLLLAPIYKLWGLNLTSMKVEVILIFLLSLFAIYLAFRNELQWPYLPALIALVGFNPQFWLFKDKVLSDLPFLLFSYLSFYLIHEAYQAGRAQTSRIVYALLISVSIYLAYGTRSIGLVLIPCLFIYHVIKNKRAGLFGVFTILLTVAFIYLQTRSSHSDSAYTDHLGINVMNVALAHSRLLIQCLSWFWDNGYSKVLHLALFAILAGLAVVGCFARIRNKQVTCFELFVPFYLGPFIILPVSLEVRFVMPIIPLYIFYAFVGIQDISRLAGDRRRVTEKFAFAAVLVAILASYAGQYARLDYGPIQEGIAKTETQQLFDYVKRETGENEVVIFGKPRALSLFTGRAAAIWHYSTEDGELWDFFRKVNASYLVVGPENIEPENQTFIRSFVDRNRERLQETFANADFRVYRIVKGTA
ncbi:MAG: hypothetical protein ACREEM_03180 [Blastocatellia bacterium]